MKIRYIGKKPSRADTLYGTGLVWNGHGDVQTCTDPAKAKLLLRHTDMFEPADGEPMREQQRVKSLSILIGTDSLPAHVDVGGDTSVALGDLVRAAHEESGLSVEQWNELPQVDRDGAIHAVLQRAKAAVAARAGQGDTASGDVGAGDGNPGGEGDQGSESGAGGEGGSQPQGGQGDPDGKPQFVMATEEGPLVLDELDKETLRKIAKDLGVTVSNNAGEETLRRRLVEAHPVS